MACTVEGLRHDKIHSERNKNIMTTKYAEHQISNGAEGLIAEPFSVKVKIQGTQDLLFHAWNDEAVSQKANARKGSEEKKRDNPESYIYRNDEGYICMPGRYIVRSIVEAGRNFLDPRSARKTAKDLVQAAVMADEMLSPVLVKGKPTKEWEYDDRQRVCIMRSAITRTRPAFKKGWEVDFTLVSLASDLVPPDFLRKLIDNAGLLIGVGDFRPTYGRFRVNHWEIVPYVSAEVC